MIATVTLNPAVDKTLHTSRVILGTVNRADGVNNMAGGKGINVAKVLKQYGYDVKTLGFLGGYNGTLIGDSVKNMGITDAFIRVEGETRTSINVIAEDGYITEFLEPGPVISEDEKERFLKSFKEEIRECEIVIICGSAPVGIEPEFYAKMINLAKEQGKKVFLDSSGESLRCGAKALPDMIKPNMRELETLMGRRIRGMQEVEEAASMIVGQGIPNVMVYMRSKGILYARENDKGQKEPELMYIQAPAIKVVNSVGSGDSAVAAYAMSVLEGRNPLDTLKHCVAVSAANAMSLENGSNPMEKVDEIEATLQLNTAIF